MRLDVLVTLLPPERSLVVAPHGILGQSFDGSGIAVDGAVDPKPQPGELMTTKAMAEGSIEGAWQDYVMPSPYATFFRYSRFGLTKADPRNVSALSGRKVPFAASSSTSATASHDDGADETTRASRRRLAEECDPPSPPPPRPPSLCVPRTEWESGDLGLKYSAICARFDENLCGQSYKQSQDEYTERCEWDPPPAPPTPPPITDDKAVCADWAKNASQQQICCKNGCNATQGYMCTECAASCAAWCKDMWVWVDKGTWKNTKTDKTFVYEDKATDSPPSPPPPWPPAIELFP